MTPNQNPKPQVGDVWLFPIHGVQHVGRIERLTDYGMFATMTLANGTTSAMYVAGARYSSQYKRLRVAA